MFNNSQIVYIVGAVLWQIATLPGAAGKECLEPPMDECASKLSFFGNRKNLKMPTNETEMQTFCTEYKDNIDCIERYTNDCLESWPHQLMGSHLKRNKRQQRYICQSAVAREDLARVFACISSEMVSSLHLAIEAAIVRYEYISTEEVGRDSKIACACCSYDMLERDVGDILYPSCHDDEDNNEHALYMVISLIHGAAGSSYGLDCGRSLSCLEANMTSLYRGNLERLTQLVRRGQMKAQHRSLMAAFIDILDYFHGY